MKVVYNACYGGFGLSYAAVMRYAELKGMKIYAFVDSRDKYGHLDLGKVVPASKATADAAFTVHYCTSPEYSDGTYWSDRDIERDDPALVQVVEELGEDANGNHADLRIEDVASGASWRIDEYDGNERVMTQDQYNWKVAR